MKAKVEIRDRDCIVECPICGVKRAYLDQHIGDKFCRHCGTKLDYQDSEQEKALIAALDKIDFQEVIACAGTNVSYILTCIENENKLPYEPTAEWLAGYLFERGFADGIETSTKYFLKINQNKC